jgi:hypothetical protein
MYAIASNLAHDAGVLRQVQIGTRAHVVSLGSGSEPLRFQALTGYLVEFARLWFTAVSLSLLAFTASRVTFCHMGQSSAWPVRGRVKVRRVDARRETSINDVTILASERNSEISLARPDRARQIIPT